MYSFRISDHVDLKRTASAVFQEPGLRRSLFSRGIANNVEDGVCNLPYSSKMLVQGAM